MLQYRTMLRFSSDTMDISLKKPESWHRAGVGKLLVVLCRSNVANSLSVPTNPSPPYFYIQ